MNPWPDRRLVRRRWVRAGLYAADTLGAVVRCAQVTPRPSAIRRIYLHRPEELGDVVTLAPAVRRVFVRFPGAAVYLGVRRQFVGLARRVLDPRLTVADRIEGDFDLALVFDGNIRKLWRVRPHTRCLAGFGVRGGSFLLDVEGAYRSDVHISNRCVDLVEEVYRRLAPAETFTLLHPGCGRAEKLLPIELWREVAVRLSEMGARLVVTGTVAEKALCDAIADGNLAGVTSLEEWADLAARAECIIAPDTGVIHLARGFNVPTVGLFLNPDHVLEWGYEEARHRTLLKPDADAVVRTWAELVSRRPASAPLVRAALVGRGPQA